MIQTTPEQIEKFRKCLKRELGFRARVYPKFVALGKMNQETMDEEMTTMQEMMAYFDKLAIMQGPQQTKLF